MLYGLIVLYNKNVSDSITYNCLKSDKKIKILIFDNSDIQFRTINEQYCKENNISYYTLNKNVGISKAYNYVIDRIEKEGYIMILDDDTLIDSNYINEAIKLSTNSIYDINLPIVVSNNKIISPANVQFGCRIKIVDNIGQLDINRISAINSGMIIRLNIFNKIKYNEKLFLDYVDHDFMKKSRKDNLNINVMDAKIIQNYSRFQKNNVQSEIIRFKIYLKDFKIYCRDCNNILFYYISTFKYKIHQVIKYKTLKFLFIK